MRARGQEAEAETAERPWALGGPLSAPAPSAGGSAQAPRRPQHHVLGEAPSADEERQARHSQAMQAEELESPDLHRAAADPEADLQSLSWTLRPAQRQGLEPPLDLFAEIESRSAALNRFWGAQDVRGSDEECVAEVAP